MPCGVHHINTFKPMKTKSPKLSREEEQGYRAGFKAGTETNQGLQKSLSKALKVQRGVRMQAALESIIGVIDSAARVRTNTFLEITILNAARRALKKC